MRTKASLSVCLLFVCLFVVLALPGTASAAECTRTWTGAASGEWQVAENWSPEEVPLATDVACVPEGKTAQVVSGTNAVEVLQGDGTLWITAGSLALLGPEPSHIATLHLSGGALRGAGELLLTERLHADGGSMEGAGKTVIGAAALGHVDALEEGEGPGLRLTGKRELDVKGVLEVAGLGGHMNVIEGAFVGVLNAGEMAIKGPEGRVDFTESADLVNARDLFVGGPEGRLVLNDNATLLNSQDLVLESPSGGLLSQDETSIDNSGNLTMKASAGELRLDGSALDNSGTLRIDAPEGRIRGTKGATVDNSGTLIVNGEGEGNGLVAGTGTIPKLTNTGTVLKDAGTEAAIVEFKTDNEDLVEAEAGILAFTGGGNSGQEHVDRWFATGEEAQVVFSGAAFTFGEHVAMSGMIVGLNSASLKGHRFTADEAEVALTESTLEITGANDESRFGTISTTDGEVGLVKEGELAAEEIFLAPGTFDSKASTTTRVGDFWQEGGVSSFGADADARFESSGLEAGSLTIGGSSDVNLGSYFQVGGETSIGAESIVVSAFPFVGNGTFEVGGSGNVDLGSFFQEAGETRIGDNSDLQSESPYVAGGAFEVGGGTEVSFGSYYQQGGAATFAAGSSLNAEETFIQDGALAFGEGVGATVGDFYLQEGLVTLSAGSAGSFAKGYLEDGTLEGAGTVAVGQLGWERATMAGSGSTVVTELGSIVSGEGFASLDERRLVTQGFFTLGKEGTLMMGDGAQLRNEAEFDASSEATGFGTQIRVAEESVANPRIVNLREFNKESGTGTTVVTVPFENNGSIRQFSGRLQIVNRLGVPASERFGFRCHCGDPIETASGDFVENQTDIAIGGRGVGLMLTRSYSAMAAAEAAGPGAFGYGWFSSFTDRIEFGEEGRVTLVRANGGTEPFTSDGEGGFEASDWSQATLSGNPETGYAYVGADQVTWHFAPSGALQSVVDRNGNETTLDYTEAGRLKTITDPAERQITFTYNGEGLVESAEDPMGHVVAYGYEGGELTSVTLPGEAEPRWQFEYDPSHRLTKMIDGRGGETTNEYDEADRVVAQVDPVGTTLALEYDGFHTRFTNEGTEAVTDMWFNSDNEPTSITRGYGTEDATTEAFAYDEAGHQLSRTDGNGHTTTFGYSPAGDRIRRVDAVEAETKWEYDAAHDLISETTPNGETTTIVRDPSGNPETISRPAPGEKTQTTTFEYDAFGKLEALTDPLNRTWTFAYNGQGDRIAETNPEGETRSWDYNQNSKPISMVSPRGNEEGAEAAEFTTTFELDAQGRLEELIDPLRNATKYVYDGNGNLESRTDAKEQTTEFAYNALDEPTETKKPNGAIVKTEYDAEGRVTAQIDGNGDPTTYVRDVLGNPIEIVDPLERKTLQDFDSAGNLITVVDAAERTTTYSYDDADRLEAIDYSQEATPDASFEYDPDGNLVRMLDGSGESTYEFDQLGRLERTTNGHGDTIVYEYNLAGEQERITYPNGKDVDQTFDEAGRLGSVTDWLGGTTSFAYDADSNLEAIEYPAATDNLDEFTYDPNGRMLSVAMTKGPEALAGIAYERDELGQVEAMTSEGLPGPAEETYAYDENSRLVKAGSEEFGYDPADNPIEMPGSVNAFDKASQIESGTGVSYEFSLLGERVKATPSAGPATNYAYDQAGNLTSVGRTGEGEVPGINEAFEFDASGLLTTHTSGEATNHLSWDPTGRLPQPFDDTGYSYIYGPFELPIEQISSSEEPSFLHPDQIGSTRLLTDAEGESLRTSTYGAYGALRGSTGEAESRMGFAGQYTLPQSGLQYLRARLYDPATGQFLSEDPLAAVTRQPYAYALDDPQNNSDPSGLEVQTEGIPCVWPVCGPPPPAVQPLEDGYRSFDRAADEAEGWVADAWDSIFGGGDDAERPVLTRAQREYEEEHNECPVAERNWRQDKKVTERELEEAGLDAHELKRGQKGTDIYKDRDGNLYEKPQGGLGPGDPLGINLKDLLR